VESVGEEGRCGGTLQSWERLCSFVPVGTNEQLCSVGWRHYWKSNLKAEIEVQKGQHQLAMFPESAHPAWSSSGSAVALTEICLHS
jgi:hypothetical protein